MHHTRYHIERSMRELQDHRVHVGLKLKDAQATVTNLEAQVAADTAQLEDLALRLRELEALEAERLTAEGWAALEDEARDKLKDAQEALQTTRDALVAARNGGQEVAEEAAEEAEQAAKQATRLAKEVAEIAERLGGDQ